MNKKQRVLTIIALIAFVVIGACHYLEWPPLVLGKQAPVPVIVWKELNYEEALSEPHREFSYEEARGDADALPSAIAQQLLKQGGYMDSKWQWHPYTRAEADLRFVPQDAKLWFRVEREINRWVWNPYVNSQYNWRYAMIPDLRIPWFMLGVIYVGLFFLLKTAPR